MATSTTHASSARRLAVPLGILVGAIICTVGWIQWDAWMVIPKKRAAVMGALRDPASAQFKDERVSAAGYACGRVNAKNGMGGYTGFQRYASTEIDFVMEDSTGPSFKEVPTAELIERLDWKIQFMKTKGREPTEKEEQQSAFELRWLKVCGDPS